MFSIISNELKKIFSLKTVILYLLCYLISAIAGFLYVSYQAQHEIEITFSVLLDGYHMGYFIWCLGLPALLTSYMHFDYETGMIRTIYTALETRRSYLTFKWIACLTLIGLGQFVSFLVSYLLAVVLRKVPFVLTGFGHFLMYYLAYFAMSVCLATFVLFLAYFIRNTNFCSLLCMAIFLGVGFLEQVVMGEKWLPLLIGGMQKLSATMKIMHFLIYICSSILYIVIMLMILSHFMLKENV